MKCIIYGTKFCFIIFSRNPQAHFLVKTIKTWIIGNRIADTSLSSEKTRLNNVSPIFIYVITVFKKSYCNWYVLFKVLWLMDILLFRKTHSMICIEFVYDFLCDFLITWLFWVYFFQTFKLVKLFIEKGIFLTNSSKLRTKYFICIVKWYLASFKSGTLPISFHMK